MTTKQINKRAQALEFMLHRLQAKIYDFSSQLDDDGRTELSELASSSGFELDVSQQVMRDIISKTTIHTPFELLNQKTYK